MVIEDYQHNINFNAWGDVFGVVGVRKVVRSSTHILFDFAGGASSLLLSVPSLTAYHSMFLANFLLL